MEITELKVRYQKGQPKEKTNLRSRRFVALACLCHLNPTQGQRNMPSYIASSPTPLRVTVSLTILLQ